MQKTCTHLDDVAEVTPSGGGCQECLQSGGHWVHCACVSRAGTSGAVTARPGATRRSIITTHTIR